MSKNAIRSRDYCTSVGVTRIRTTNALTACLHVTKYTRTLYQRITIAMCDPPHAEWQQHLNILENFFLPVASQ